MSINNYHKSMFTGEIIHESWVTECAQYLQSIFGDQVAGKTVIDYGFGRGNWSLAFRQLGAKHVISVEASRAAAQKFQDYLDAFDIENISVVVGNADEKDLELKADLVFLYGIFHHVEQPNNLLLAAKSWLASENGKVLVYAYDGGSMREIVVNACRAMLSNIELEAGWELALHPHARHRAVDDLVAPEIRFWTVLEMLTVGQDIGFDCITQTKDFSQFQGKSLAPEFDPYVLVLQPSSGQVKAIECAANVHVYRDEYSAIEEVLEQINLHCLPAEKKNCVLGLFNSWFAGAGQVKFEQKLFYLWRYLCHFVTSSPSIEKHAQFSQQLEVLLCLTRRVDHPNTQQYVKHCKLFKQQINSSSFRI